MDTKTPMKIDHILDDVVLLILDGHKPLGELGIDKSKVYVKIVGYDEYGLWAYRPSFPVPIFKDGKPVGDKNIDASVLIPRGYIASIVHFPGEEGFDFPDPFATNLGFNINNE